MIENISLKGSVIVEVRRLGDEEFTVVSEKENLITTAGVDWIHSQLYGTVSGIASYIAVTSNSTAPAASDTTLTGEITTGGLARALGTYSHTSSTAISTVIKIFTATTTHTAVQKAGLFSAVSGGVMINENAFITPITLGAGEELRVTWTITTS